jgi:hypothetical protein
MRLVWMRLQIGKEIAPQNSPLPAAEQTAISSRDANRRDRSPSRFLTQQASGDG